MKRAGFPICLSCTCTQLRVSQCLLFASGMHSDPGIERCPQAGFNTYREIFVQLDQGIEVQRQNTFHSNSPLARSADVISYLIQCPFTES